MTTTLVHGSNIERKNIPAAYKWNLQDIYATQEDWENACAGLKELFAELGKYQGKLKAGAVIRARIESAAEYELDAVMVRKEEV